jgi:hypothetical protein
MRVAILKRSICRVGFTLAGMLLAGCAVLAGNRVQAPFDSYVCTNKTPLECASMLDPKKLTSGLKFLKSSKSHEKPFDFSDTDADKQVFSEDKKFHCDYGHAPYKQLLDVNLRASIVFFSPIALSQASESLFKVTRARETCQRLIAAYDNQLSILAVQDNQAAQQAWVQYLTAEIEGLSLLKNDLGKDFISDDALAAMHMPPGYHNSVRFALHDVRGWLTYETTKLRALYRDQTVNVEYGKQFVDAQTSIELQLREMGRNLFLLDQSSLTFDGTIVARFYRDGAWVRQGTDVLQMLDGAN